MGEQAVIATAAPGGKAHPAGTSQAAGANVDIGTLFKIQVGVTPHYKDARSIICMAQQTLPVLGRMSEWLKMRC